MNKKNVLIVVLLIIIILIGYSFFQTKKAIAPSPTQEELQTPNEPMTGDVVETTTGSLTFSGVGTEPFWAITIDTTQSGDIQAHFTSAENITGTIHTGFVETGTTATMRSFVNPEGMQIIVSANSTQPDVCSDGMSDRVYDAYLTLTFPDNTTYNGCALGNLF